MHRTAILGTAGRSDRLIGAASYLREGKKRMKELEYPFDNGFIMKKKRSLKRQLLGDGAVRLKKRVAVLGGSTTDDIVSVLELFLLDKGFECEFYQSEYGQFWQDAVFSNEELDRFKPDIVYIHTSLRNLSFSPTPGRVKRR